MRAYLYKTSSVSLMNAESLITSLGTVKQSQVQGFNFLNADS